MKKASIFIIAATFLFAFIAGPVSAQTAQQDQQEQRTLGQQEQGQQEQQNPLRAAGMHKASDLMGKTVMSQQGEEIGSVNDIIIGENGQAKYLIFSRGEILGIGGELVPVPWEAANLQMQEDQLVSSLDKQRVEDAPSFKGDGWATFSQPGYEQEVHSYYGTQPQQQQQQGFQVITPETGTKGAEQPGMEKQGMEQQGMEKQGMEKQGMEHQGMEKQEKKKGY